MAGNWSLSGGDPYLRCFRQLGLRSILGGQVVPVPVAKGGDGAGPHYNQGAHPSRNGSLGAELVGKGGTGLV